MPTIMMLWGFISAMILVYLGFMALRFSQSLKLLHEQSEKIPEKGWPLVTIVIAARDEEQTIKAASQLLQAVDYPHLQIIMVDDRSTDRTFQIMEQIAAGDSRVQVIQNKVLPSDWLGKTHAIHLGSQNARGEWILFTDADVHFAESSLKKALNFSESEKCDFLAVLPEFQCTTLPLKVFISYTIHFICSIIRAEKISDPSSPDFVGVGAFNLVKKEILSAAGGFQSIRLDLADDVALGRLIKSSGGKECFLGGRGELLVDWYPSWSHLLRGVNKSAIAVSDYSYFILFINTFLPILISLGFIFSLIKGSLPIPFLLLVLGFYFFTTSLQLRRVGFSGFLCFTLLLGMIVCPFVFAWATLTSFYSGKITWRDTSYDLQLLKKNQKVKVVDMVLRRSLNGQGQGSTD